MSAQTGSLPGGAWTHWLGRMIMLLIVEIGSGLDYPTGEVLGLVARWLGSE